GGQVRRFLGGNQYLGAFRDEQECGGDGRRADDPPRRSRLRDPGGRPRPRRRPLARPAGPRGLSTRLGASLGLGAPLLVSIGALFALLGRLRLVAGLLSLGGVEDFSTDATALALGAARVVSGALALAVLSVKGADFDGPGGADGE